LIIVTQGSEQTLEGAGVADFAQGPGSLLADPCSLITQGGEERLDGAGVADFAQSQGSHLADQ